MCGRFNIIDDPLTQLLMEITGKSFEEVLTETFRRLVLDALVREDRLTEDFCERLLTFRHGGGFSVYGRHLILNEEPAARPHGPLHRPSPRRRGPGSPDGRRARPPGHSACPDAR